MQFVLRFGTLWKTKKYYVIYGPVVYSIWPRFSNQYLPTLLFYVRIGIFRIRSVDLKTSECIFFRKNVIMDGFNLNQLVILVSKYFRKNSILNILSWYFQIWSFDFWTQYVLRTLNLPGYTMCTFSL